MSAMGNKELDVQEDIVDLLNGEKTLEEIKEIIEETHGSMYVDMVEDCLYED